MGWRIVLWILLVLAAILVILIFLPVGIRVRYRHSELKIWYIFGPFRFMGYPEKHKSKEKKKDSKINMRTVFSEPIKANRKYDSVLGDFLAELKTVLGMFLHLRPKLRIKRLELKLHLNGENPAALAMQYGGAWAAIGGLVPFLEESFILKKQELDVDCGFSGGATSLDAKLDISIGLGRLLFILIRYSLLASEKTNTTPIERRS